MISTKRILLYILFTSIAIVSFAQQPKLTITKITKNSLQFSYNNSLKNGITLIYGLTKNLELGEVKGLTIKNLLPSKFYYVKVKSEDNALDKENYIQLFSTASSSSGDIKVYFNNIVDNNASSITNAIYTPYFEDTIATYINLSQNTLDICNYNTGSAPIINAINAAETRGVIIRYIAADNTGTNNNELSNLSPTIHMIQRPADGEVMHNKFILIDAATATLAQVLTGSTNHTYNSCHDDYNNMVVVEDQSLVLAYQLEFEEMWGSNGNLPNIGNSKFGNAKTDNTPHTFNVGGVPIELYFSPSDGTTSKIETALLSATTDIQFAILTFINNDLGNAIIAKQNAGLNIKGIIENVLYFGSEYNGLLNAGVDVHSHFSEPNILHHKYGVVDANNTSSDPLVITGSHNWTNSAENDYDENTLIIHDAEIANMYYEEFMKRYAEITGTVGVYEGETSTDFSFYPNPTQSLINIDLNQNDINNASIEVIDLLGKTTYQEQVTKQRITINMNSFKNGIYLLKFTNNKGSKVMKLVKE